MKTLKFVLVAAFISFSMMGYSHIGYNPGIANLNVAIETAMSNSELLLDMFHQINEDMIKGEHRGFYIARVLHKGQTYLIHGDLEAWEAYFILSKWVDNNNNSIPLKVDRYVF